MSEPDKKGYSEEFGTVEVFGIPFSTFTRSIVLGLHEFGLGPYFIQHETPPHSGEVRQRNPFGLLPVLVHRPDAIYTSNDDAAILYESNAIRRYIDEQLGPQANSRLHTSIQLTPDSKHATALQRAKVDQWVSIASTVLFPAVELGVVKPRLSMERNGADDATITVALEDGLGRLHDRLSIVEQMLGAPQAGPFMCGQAVTWADLFVYPLLADLRAIPEGKSLLVSGQGAAFPRLAAWMDSMEQRQSVKSTYEGTLADQRK